MCHAGCHFTQRPRSGVNLHIDMQTHTHTRPLYVEQCWPIDQLNGHTPTAHTIKKHCFALNSQCVKWEERAQKKKTNDEERSVSKSFAKSNGRGTMKQTHARTHRDRDTIGCFVMVFLFELSLRPIEFGCNVLWWQRCTDRVEWCESFLAGGCRNWLHLNCLWFVRVYIDSCMLCMLFHNSVLLFCFVRCARARFQLSNSFSPLIFFRASPKREKTNRPKRREFGQ